MHEKDFKIFADKALANPAEHIEALVAETFRLREKLKRQAKDQERYKAVFKKLIEPDQVFLEGLVKCKNYKQLDMYSFTVLKNMKGAHK